MSNETIESATPAHVVEPPKLKHKSAAKAKAAKKPAVAKKSKPKAERANKKAEAIALMKRAKSATLAEIMKATGWQAHTVRGFISILGKKEKIESFKSADGERTYRIK